MIPTHKIEIVYSIFKGYYFHRKYEMIRYGDITFMRFVNEEAG